VELTPGVDGPRVFDGVTLRHFGIIDRMSYVEARLVGYPEPRWTGVVKSELLAGLGRPECDAVLAVSFLGDPFEAGPSEQLAVFRLQAAIRGTLDDEDDDDSARDLGEAESIYVADKLNGTFITDDWSAYEFARKRFGSNRVMDTVALLREAVACGELTPSEAQHAADAIRNSGRHLRWGHPPTLTAEYFAVGAA
jgi:hypothetical protein